MNKFNPALRFISHLSAIIMLSLVVLLSRPAVAYGDDWKDQRCKEIQNGLTSLEQRAPQIRKEIAEREEELGLLQKFQKGSEAVYLSTILNTVPLVPRAIIGSYPGMTPELARVQGSDSAEIGLFEDGATGTKIVICALDNLGKGAAGQAVQNANLALGLPETQGLRLHGVPV